MQKPENLTVDFIPRQRRSVASVQVENEAIAFDEDRGSWHHMNPIARVIWDCCDGTGTVEEIARDISEIFEADFTTVQESVFETLRQFGTQGLLEGLEQTVYVNDHDHGHGHDHGHDHDHEAHNDDPETPAAPQPRFLGVPPSS